MHVWLLQIEDLKGSIKKVNIVDEALYSMPVDMEPCGTRGSSYGSVPIWPVLTLPSRKEGQHRLR